MRTSPLAQTLLLLACLGLLLIPLVKLTSKTASDSPTDGQTPAETADRAIPSDVTLHFAHAPSAIAIKIDGKLLWTVATDGSTEYANEFDLPFDDHTLEVELDVQWPDGTPHTVAEMEITPDGHDAISCTTWGDGTLTDYLVFKIR